MVIPGKTPLPPNKELPLRLQTVDSDPQDSLNENFWNKYIYIDKLFPSQLKFMYFEKATKFWEIFTLLLSYVSSASQK